MAIHLPSENAPAEKLESFSLLSFAPPMPARHLAPALIAYATALLLRAGLDADKAATVVAILVEADLLGHTTHGLALLPAYLAEIEKGAMTKTGEPRVIAD